MSAKSAGFCEQMWDGSSRSASCTADESSSDGDEESGDQVEVETSTGAVIQAFTSGTMVQVFQLAGVISAQVWNASELVAPA